MVVEAEEDEDDELDPDDDQDRPLEQRLVEDRDASVEAQLEREVPGGGDERRVGKELPDAMPDGSRRDFRRSRRLYCLDHELLVSGGMPGQRGIEKFSRAARSVSGSDPSSYPRKRSAGWRWSGVT